jgi:hypothetical protein
MEARTLFGEEEMADVHAAKFPLMMLMPSPLHRNQTFKFNVINENSIILEVRPHPLAAAAM